MTQKIAEDKKYNAIAFRCWIEEKGYKKSTTGWFETIYADAPGPYASCKISHVAKTDSELYDIFATSRQDPDGSNAYEKWLEESPSPSPGLRVKANERLPKKGQNLIFLILIKDDSPLAHYGNYDIDHVGPYFGTGNGPIYYLAHFMDNIEWLDESPSLPVEQTKKIGCDAIWKAIEHFQDGFKEDDSPMGYAEIESELYDVMEQIDPSVKKGAPGEQDPESVCPICDGRGRVSYYTGEDGGKEKGEQVEGKVTANSFRVADEENMTGIEKGLLYAQGMVDHSPKDREYWKGYLDALEELCKEMELTPADPISLYKASIGVSEPSVEADQHIPSEDNAKQYVSDEDKKNDAADKFRQSQEKFPSPEADQQVPEEIKTWIQHQSQKLIAEEDYYNFPRLFAETAMIAMYHHLQPGYKSLLESLTGYNAQMVKELTAEKEVNATLRSSGQTAGEEYRRDLEIVKGERNELRDLLNIINEGYSDHFTNFLNDRISEALNRFTNNTKDNG